MDTRLPAALFWLVGSMAIGGAVLATFLDQQIRVKPAKEFVEQTVSEIAKAQVAYYKSKEKYFYFGTGFGLGGSDQETAANTLKVKFGDGRFLFEAVPEVNNVLVVKAYTSPAATLRGSLAPMLYRFALEDEQSGAGKGDWVSLSGRKPGLLSLLGWN